MTHKNYINYVEKLVKAVNVLNEMYEIVGLEIMKRETLSIAYNNLRDLEADIIRIMNQVNDLCPYLYNIHDDDI